MKFKSEPGLVIEKSRYEPEPGKVFQSITIAQNGFGLKVPVNDEQYKAAPEPDDMETVEVAGDLYLIQKSGGIKPLFTNMRFSFEESRAARPRVAAGSAAAA